MAKFTASLIGGQNILFRPYIEVNDDNIRFKIPGFLSGDEQTMKIENITDIRISGDIVSKTIEIYSSGLGIISAPGFSPSDARRIKFLIDSNLQKLRSSKNQRNTDWDEPRDSQPESEQDLIERQFTSINSIPLIRFSSDTHLLLGTLNSLLHYAKSHAAKKMDEYEKKYIVAYSEKIYEGLRYSKSLNGDSFFKNEISRIEEEISRIENQTTLKTKNKNKWRLVWYIFYFFLFIYLFRACRHMF